jgi:hypothetical protein
MLTLQRLLENDSISDLISKLNNNFQTVSLYGGGPQGLPGEQGLPGIPGKQGPIGPTGVQGPTGTVMGIIPFGSTAGGQTGPSSVGGPWNSYSLEYLNTYVGTGSNVVGQIWVDHWNQGFWKFLDTNDAVTAYTNSPYSNVFAGTYPPGGTGYYSGTGWYFYPLNVTSGGVAGDVWVNDITTYQTAPPYATGPFSSNASSPLTVKNARMLSKYGTVWISSGNAIDSGGNDDDSTLDSPTIYDWGANDSLTLPQPARYNAGIDRLYFKQSIDTLPYFSNVTARSWTYPSGLTSQYPSEPTIGFPIQNGNWIEGDQYWVKPLYDVTLDKFSPIQYFTERRNDETYTPGTEYVFGSLGMYLYSGVGSYDGVTGTQIKKSLSVFSSRYSLNPVNNQFGTPLTYNDTVNIGEMLLDVKKLITSNQYVCSLPEDMYGSSDYITGGNYAESNIGNIVSYTVTQGYISSINGKSLIGSTVAPLNYGNLTDTPTTFATGNYTRSSWYGSAATVSPDLWSTLLDSGDPSNLDTHTADRTYRIAGMRERGKKNWDGSNYTNFLSELIFYTSQFQQQSIQHEATPNLTANQQNSLPVFYVSPFRNLGVGTFTTDDSGVYEPAARLHINAFIRSNDIDVSSINPAVIDRTSVWSNYPTKVMKVGAFTQDFATGLTATYTDVYLGGVIPAANETANPYLSSGKRNNVATTNLDTAIRRETWVNLAGNKQTSILRLGVSANSAGEISLVASHVATEFPVGLSPLNPNMYGPTYKTTTETPVGVGIHNLYPRSRVHLFGKNTNNEGRDGNDPWSPGYAFLAGQTGNVVGITGYYPGAGYAGQQVIVDYLDYNHVWTYNVGFRDYPYEAYGVVGATALMGSRPATGSSGSPNAANYAWREYQAPTRQVTPWALSTRNIAAYSGTAALNGSFPHGNIFDNLWTARHYVGFNLFRDLLNQGDSVDTVWRTGTTFDNGGSAIIGSNGGDLAFVNISSGRDGGLLYRTFEQQGLSTRDVLNNITMMMTRDGDIGIGNRPGFDSDTYSSRERGVNGYVHYVRTSAEGDARQLFPYPNPYSSGTATMGTGSNQNKPYGLISYEGLSATYAETISSSPAAEINRATSMGDYIRLEVGAGKVYGSNSRSTLKAGYGYPPLQTLTITGSSIRNYLFLDWAAYTTAGGNIFTMSLDTDFEGRIIKIKLQNATSSGALVDFKPYFYNFVLPHPTEFNAGSGTPWAQVGFTATQGACAAELWNYDIDSNWVINEYNTQGYWDITNESFVQTQKQYANLRLNNFVLGEGMNVSTEQQWVRDQIKEARQESPKLILSFLEADNTVIPGSRAINTTETIGQNRPVSGTDAYRKVNTVIASAQNESSLREYWIPKADNSGGTFMVWTDHYGEKEKDSGFDTNTIATSRFYVEEVVALEFVPSYTGTTAGNEYISSTATNASGKFDNDYPLHVKYYNTLMGVPKYGITGNTGGNAFTPSQYGRKVNLFGQPLGVTGGPTTQYNYGFSFQNAGLTGPNYTQLGPFTQALSSTAGSTPIVISATGKPIQLTAEGTTNGNENYYLMQFQRSPDGTTWTNIGPIFGADTGSHDQANFYLHWVDNPVSGNWYYRIIRTDGFSPMTFTEITLIAYELSSGNLFYTTSNTGPYRGVASGATGLALLRNVDKYYSIYNPTTNFDNGWNSNGEIENRASQFRFKRINSEFALIDFNMTIEVKNPDLSAGFSYDDCGETQLIDWGSPRWTQYIRLSYLPSLYTADNYDYFMRLFGNSLSLMNWSSFNQWYPGTAITSDPETVFPTTTPAIYPGDSLSNTGGPNYTMNHVYDPAHTQNLVWSGNFYDATMSSSVNSNMGNLNNGEIFNKIVSNQTLVQPNGYLTPFFANQFFNANIAKMLIWDAPSNFDGSKSYVFGSFMGKAYSILGNDYLSRVRNCTWRVVPRLGNHYGTGADLAEPTNLKNASFTLEIMFDKPILHIDTPFANYNFSSLGNTDPAHPYKYLTVNGQAIVRYSDSTNTALNGPEVILESEIS